MKCGQKARISFIFVTIQNGAPPSEERIFYFELLFFISAWGAQKKKTAIQNIYSLRRSRSKHAE
jgi:hypothetical protein